MCAMSPRLLRPVATGFHPEANAWRTAVVANGGSVSGKTMKAVSDFCADIDAYGIRDRFYRLSLCCGNSLLAALVPLYRGPSRTGTQLGYTTDTNTGLVSGDYAESSGIQGDGIGKFMQCAAAPISNMFPSGDDRQAGHLGAAFAGATATVRDVVGVNIGGNDRYIIQPAVGVSRSQPWGSRGVNWSAPDANFHIVINTRNSGTHTLYVDGSSAGTSTGSSTTPDSNLPFSVLGSGSGASSTGSYFFGRVAAYSFGAGLTSQQASDFRSALLDFFTAIGRS